MTELTTEAGRVLLTLIHGMDPQGLYPPDPGDLVLAVEAEARAALLAELRAKVEAMKADTSDLSGGTFFWGTRAGINHAIDAVLALLDPV